MRTGISPSSVTSGGTLTGGRALGPSRLAGGLRSDDLRTAVRVAPTEDRASPIDHHRFDVHKRLEPTRTVTQTSRGERALVEFPFSRPPVSAVVWCRRPCGSERAEGHRLKGAPPSQVPWRALPKDTTEGPELARFRPFRYALTRDGDVRAAEAHELHCVSEGRECDRPLELRRPVRVGAGLLCHELLFRRCGR